MARLYALPIAGIDEAGRGPWAGPVVAAAVTLDLAWTPPDDLNDSKQITEARRGELFALIQSGALGFGIGIATHQEIDALNIRRATHLAMTRAMEALRAQGDYRILVTPDHPTPLRTKTHSHGFVPFALAGTGVAVDAAQTYSETTAGSSPVAFADGWKLMRYFLGG